VGFCEDDNEHSGSTKDGKFLDQLSGLIANNKRRFETWKVQEFGPAYLLPCTHYTSGQARGIVLFQLMAGKCPVPCMT
jgi:hypothetical protein